MIKKFKSFLVLTEQKPISFEETEYLYHGTTADLKKIFKSGLRAGARKGMEGYGVYFSTDYNAVFAYVPSNANVLRVNKEALIKEFGIYPNGNIEIGEDVLVEGKTVVIPSHLLEVESGKNRWFSLSVFYKNG